MFLSTLQFRAALRLLGQMHEKWLSDGFVEVASTLGKVK